MGRAQGQQDAPACPQPAPPHTHLPAQAPKPEQGLTEAQQEQLLKAKYGGMVPKRKLLGPQGAHKYFDSGDYFGGGGKERLPPKLQPEPSQPAMRRSSQLGDGQQQGAPLPPQPPPQQQ